MKKFLIHISGIVFVFFLLLFALDFLYTSTYNEANPRTKYQYLKSLQNSKINYIFLGSSRVDNGIIPQVIESATHKKTVNFGFQGAKIGDIYTVLKLLQSYHITSDTIFIQLDYNFNEKGHSINLPYEMTPFLNDNEITKEYLIDYIGKTSLYYFPFIRYCQNDAKIGFRELFANLIHKKTKVVSTKGYSVLKGEENKNELHRSLPEFIVSRNQYYEKIKKWGIEKKLNIVFFCAPFCKQTRNLDYVNKLKQKIPDLYDFSNAIGNDKMFVNCYHLNDNGAQYFSKVIVKKILKK